MRRYTEEQFQRMIDLYQPEPLGANWYKFTIFESLPSGKSRSATVHMRWNPEEGSVAHRVTRAQHFGSADNHNNGPTIDPWKWVGLKLKLWEPWPEKSENIVDTPATIG